MFQDPVHADLHCTYSYTPMFMVTAPLRVRGCFFGVLLVSTWRFPGLGGVGGGAGGGNYVHW